MQTFIIITQYDKDGTCGFCETVASTVAELYKEIRDFMFDCPLLTDISMKVNIKDLTTFIEAEEESLDLGTTTDEIGGVLGKCHFTLKRGSNDGHVSS